MIVKLHIKNFKAVADAEITLTPLHLLIGPNDSGKTSILEAIAALARSLDHSISDSFLGRWASTQLVHSGGTDNRVTFEASIANSVRGTYRLSCAFYEGNRSVMVKEASWNNKSIAIGNEATLTGYADPKSVVGNPSYSPAVQLRDAICPAWYLRWSARNLALPATLSPQRHFRLAGNGFGLPTLLDDLLNDSRERFSELEKRFCDQFSDVVGLQLRQEKAYDSPVDDPEETLQLKAGNGKQLYFALRSGGSIPAPQAAEGMLYTLAYLAIAYLPNPPKILLVEEPENGIHPARVREVVRLLRQMTEGAQGIQVIMSSHSPYLVDEMKPEEVTWCRREAGQVVTQRLDENETVIRQQGLFELGEIWSNYLDPVSGSPEE